jgi:hypothetical protein
LKVCTGIPYDAFVSPPLPVGSSSAAVSSSTAASSSHSLTLEDVYTIATPTSKRLLPSLDDEYEVSCPSWLRSKLCTFLGLPMRSSAVWNKRMLW